MRAFIKMGRWLEFMETHKSYSFFCDVNPKDNKSMFVRIADDKGENERLPIFLIVTMDRELHLVTPFGESPFMESHEESFKDLLNEDLVEYIEGNFD